MPNKKSPCFYLTGSIVAGILFLYNFNNKNLGVLMSYLTEQQLKAFGFKKLGCNVLISDKASIYNADQIEVGDNTILQYFVMWQVVKRA